MYKPFKLFIMRKIIFLMLLQFVFYGLFAQSGVRNNTNIKVMQGTYFVVNSTTNYTNSATATTEINGAMRVGGTTTNAAGTAGITVKNGASLLQNTNGVSAIVNQNILADRWHFISNPIAAFDMTQSFAGAYVYEYIESYNGVENDDAWLNITAGNMNTDRGYLVKNYSTNRTINYSGVLNNGNMVYPLSYTATSGVQAGYNLVGNPYSTALDWTSATGFDKSNITGAIYIWNDATTQYGTSNGTVALLPMTSNIIPACQAFIVKATSAATFTINNNAKTLDFSTPFYKTDIDDLLRIRLIGNGKTDETVVYFDENASQIYDLGTDADKFIGTKTNLYTTSANNYELAINATSNEKQNIPLNFSSDTNGDFKLLINEYTFDSDSIYLEDTQNGSFTLLNQNVEYSFNHNVNDKTNRFILHFNTTQNEVLSDNFKIFGTQGKANIMNAEGANIEIYDILGKLQYTNILNSNYEQIELHDAAIYVVKLVKDNNIVVKKIFIQ